MSQPPPAVLPLETARLRLRPLAEDDVDALHRIYAHPEVARWIGAHDRERVREEVLGHVALQRERGYAVWAVEERGSGTLVGDCGLQPLEWRGPEIELGYDFDPAVWGRGYATEAARACLEAALGPLGLERVVAVVKPRNGASRRVLEKAGMRREGERYAYGEPLLLYARGRDA